MEPTMHFRWLISHRSDYERVLQQLWRDPTNTDKEEWRDVPEVIEPRQIQPEAESGRYSSLQNPPPFGAKL